MDWRFVVLLGVLGVPVLIWLLNRPWRHRNVRFGDLERYFSSWIGDLDSGAVVVLREDATGHFVQFVLSKERAKPELEFGFPDAEWSRDLFRKVSLALEEAGIGTHVQTTGVEEVGRFLVTTVRGADESLPARAVRVATTALRAMGHDESSTLTVWADGKVDPQASARALERLLDHRNPMVRAWARSRWKKSQRK